MDDAQERKIATEVREGFEANDKKLRKSYGKERQPESSLYLRPHHR